MNDVGVINRFLDTFNSYIDSGFGLLGGEVAFLTTTLIVIDITLAGLFWAWGADEDVMHRLVKKVLYVGFFAFVIGNFSALAGIVFDSFAGLGLKASGASISLADFMKPGSVAATGFDAGEPLLDAMGDLMGFRSFFANFIQIAVLLVAWVKGMLAASAHWDKTIRYIVLQYRRKAISKRRHGQSAGRELRIPLLGSSGVVVLE